MIEVGDEFDGIIIIDGRMDNAVTGPEIRVGSIDTSSLGASIMDYDGYDPADTWDDDARIKVDTAEYPGNTLVSHIYLIPNCRDGMDNDSGVGSDDVIAHALSQAAHATAYAGLLGSRLFHSDLDCDEDIDAVDSDWTAHFATPSEGCCFSDCDYGACLVDTDKDGDVDLADLATLLGNYGITTGAKVEEGDFDGDGDVDLADLSRLLTDHGDECSCFPGNIDGGGEGGADGSHADVSVEAYDTGGYSGGGANLELDHFAFDLKIEVLDPNNDDWVATGVRLRTFNDATFRLSSTATPPDAHATFVAPPWTSVQGSATGNLAGGYYPPNQSGRFTTAGINLDWYDCAASNDGRATVMRIVIDASGVDGADVLGSFGSVYFGLHRD